MPLREITSNLVSISDLYAKRFSIERSADWFLIKIQEELGELSAAYLKKSGRGRCSNESPETLKKNMEDELADLLAMTLLFAESQGIDPMRSIQQKWYKHLEAARETLNG